MAQLGPGGRSCLPASFRLFKKRNTDLQESGEGVNETMWVRLLVQAQESSPRIFSSCSNGFNENRWHGLHLMEACRLGGQASEAEATSGFHLIPLEARECGGWTRVPIPMAPFTGCVIMASYSPSLCLSLSSWEVEIMMTPPSEGCDGA